jgi:hypothetical protein
VLARGARGRRLLIACLVLKKTRNSSQFEQKNIIVKKLQMRTANKNREYKPSEFYLVTSLKTIRTGILDFLFSTVVQNKFLKRGPK